MTAFDLALEVLGALTAARVLTAALVAFDTPARKRPKKGETPHPCRPCYN